MASGSVKVHLNPEKLHQMELKEQTNLGTQVLMARDRWDEQTPPANGVSFFSFFLSL